MRQSSIAVINPQWVSSDIFDNDLLPRVGGCTAGTRARPNRDSVNCICVSLGKAGRAAVLQLTPSTNKMEARAPAGLLLHQSAEAVKYFRKGISFRDELENSLFAGNQGFCSLAIFYVCQDAVPSEHVSVFVAQRHGADQKPAKFPVRRAAETGLIFRTARRSPRRPPTFSCAASRSSG